MQWIVPDVWGAHWTFVPAFSLVVIILISVAFGVNRGLVYGALFGLMHDLAFGHIIGAYVFSFAFVAYFAGQFIKQFHPHNVLILTTVLIGVALQTSIIFGLYKLFDVTQMEFRWMVYRLLLPSLLFNGLFTVLTLRPLKRWFAKMGAQIEN